MFEFHEYKGREILIIKDAQLLSRPYRNFEGKTSDYNPTGQREFGVVIEDPELAQKMAENLWNVKTITNRDGRAFMGGVKCDGEDLDWFKVKVKYKDKRGEPLTPPNIMINTENNTQSFGEEDVKELDGADLMDVQLKINIDHQVINGKPMTIGYLASMRATMIDDNYWFGDRRDEEPF